MSNFSTILERFSTRAKAALVTSQKMAEKSKVAAIGTEHLLFGIVSETSSLASEVILKAGVTLEEIQREIMKLNSSAAAAAPPRMSSELRGT
ncbi:MAG: Clp protease N-terminal domain-containing protein, partial [Patescibacteria group bacterium]